VSHPAVLSNPASTPGRAWTSPPAHGVFDYQIGAAYPPADSVQIVDRDRGAAAVAGRYNICYLNAFQTQPDEHATWPPDLVVLIDGRPVEDPDWPGEWLLDTSTAADRDRIAAIVGGWIDGCARAGYQAIEPDNLDSWTRSHGRLTQADNESFARLLIARAHADGLAIGQKNTPQLGTAGRALGFDFAIAEECQVFDECSAYFAAYGAEVIEIEYTDNGRSAFAAACAAQGRDISVILRDRDVVAPSDPAYAYRTC
jgi:hypothetical protein